MNTPLSKCAILCKIALSILLVVTVQPFAGSQSVKPEGSAPGTGIVSGSAVKDSTTQSLQQATQTTIKSGASTTQKNGKGLDKTGTGVHDSVASIAATNTRNSADTLSTTTNMVRNTNVKKISVSKKTRKPTATNKQKTGNVTNTTEKKPATTLSSKTVIAKNTEAKKILSGNASRKTVATIKKPSPTTTISAGKPAVLPPSDTPAKAILKPPVQVKAKVASKLISEDRYPKQPISFNDGVTGLPDLTYATIPGFRPLTLDLYLPPDSLSVPSSGFPLVVHIHGGGWMTGHARHAGAFENFPQVLASLAARGYVVASVNYRLSAEAPSPAAVIDIKTAIRWLRSKASQYRIDPMKAAVWGGSAGGQLAGLVAVTCGVKWFDPCQPAPADIVYGKGGPSAEPLPEDVVRQSDCVQAAVSWYGIFDFTTLRKHAGVSANRVTPGIQAAINYLGCDHCPPGLAKGASSTLYVDKNDPPMLLIHGASDKVVPCKQSEEMAKKLTREGVPVTLLLLDGVGHGFIGPFHQRTTTASLKALNATFDFFDKTIGATSEQ